MSVNRRQTEAQLRKLAEFAQLNPNPAIEFDVHSLIDFGGQATSQPGTVHTLSEDDIKQLIADGGQLGRSACRKREVDGGRRTRRSDRATSAVCGSRQW